MSVPLIIIIIIFVIYILTGAYIFHNLENWSLRAASYFAFITVATIGFGDLVPGTYNSTTHGQNLIITTVYIIIGMAILAMCFDLIQKNLKKNFNWISKQVSLHFNKNKNNKVSFININNDNGLLLNNSSVLN